MSRLEVVMRLAVLGFAVAVWYLLVTGGMRHQRRVLGWRRIEGGWIRRTRRWLWWFRPLTFAVGVELQIMSACVFVGPFKICLIWQDWYYRIRERRKDS